MGGDGVTWFGKLANCLVPMKTLRGDPSFVLN